MDERRAPDTDAAATSSPPAEASVPARIAAAHDAAFSNFYRSFTPRLVGFLRWQGVPLHDATDICQETMAEAYKNWTIIRNPQAWTRRVASRKWARQVGQLIENPVADLPEQNTPLLGITDVEAWEQRHHVLQALAKLPLRQRQVLAWNLEGYGPTEIAEELRMTPDAVRSSLLKARRAIAEYLRTIGEL